MSGLSWAKMAKAESRSHRHLVREASSGTVRQPRQDQAPGGEAEAEALLEGGTGRRSGERGRAAVRAGGERARRSRGGTAPPATSPHPPDTLISPATPGPASPSPSPGPGPGPDLPPRPPPRSENSVPSHSPLCKRPPPPPRAALSRSPHIHLPDPIAHRPHVHP